MKMKLLTILTFIGLSVQAQTYEHIRKQIDSLTSWFNESDVVYHVNKSLDDQSMTVLYDTNINTDSVMTLSVLMPFSRKNEDLATNIIDEIKADINVYNYVARNMCILDVIYDTDEIPNFETGAVYLVETITIKLKQVN